jgi:hypothetical protein
VSLVTFAVASLCTLAIALLQGAKTFYYDSGNYWTLGETFVEHGHFSLLNYESALRGYLLPLIDHGLRGLAAAVKWRSSSSAKLLNVLVFSAIGAVLTPRLAELTWPRQHWGLWRRLALMALLLVFWNGYLAYPLSDIPALAMVLLAILATSRPYAPASMLLAGVASAAAIDMRPSYVPLAVVVLALIVWGWVSQRDGQTHGTARRTLCMGMLLAGFAVVSLPQSLATHRHFDTWSFIPGTVAHLENIQLTEGLSLQLYGTYVGADHGPQMDYVYGAGLTLLEEQSEPTVKGTGQYFELMLEHPLTIGTALGLHLINGLDSRYSTPYPEHAEPDLLLRLFGFLLVFLALLRVLWPTARRSLGSARWRYPLALLVCCLTSLPSAVETRYLLPVDILCYLLVLAPGWPSPIPAQKTGPRRYLALGGIVIAYAAFMAVVWHVTSGASNSLQFR